MMTPRTETALQAACLHIHGALDSAADTLLASTKSPGGARGRDPVAAVALSELQHNLREFKRGFAGLLREKVLEDSSAHATTGRRPLDTVSWETLTLVEEDEVEERVSADRLGTQIAHACEWQLRELDGYVAALLHGSTASPERNPLRPAVVGKALQGAVHAVIQAADQRRALLDDLGRALAPAMKPCYAAIVVDLQSRGIRPVGMSALKSAQGSSTDLQREGGNREAAGRTGSGFKPSTRDPSQAEQMLASMFGIPLPEPQPAGGPNSQSGARLGPELRNTNASAAPGGDLQMLQILRQINANVSRSGGLTPHPASADGAVGGRGFAGSGAGALGAPNDLSGLMAVNLIRQHRDELMRASSGTLDHMVIDVVGALFDQVLADAKVPPQVARQIARLQMPVLRAALKDSSFFNSRRHPVRRFVNRIASLATAYEDLEGGPGREFIERVAALVQEIVDGDFDQIEVYDTKLAQIESLIERQSERDVGAHASAAAVLEVRETQLRIQQRYMRDLTTRLEDVELPPFVRNFLAQVWSQVQVHAAGPQGSPEWVQRAHRTARELAVSVQPKGEPQLRKHFLMALPQLMKDLNEGLALIRWPETAKKEFFGQLLPCHAESLKTAPPTDFERRQLKHRLEQLEKVAIPTAETLDTGSGPHLPSPSEHAAPLTFSAEEAERVGLVDESAVDWDGQVDIDLADAAAAAEVDVALDLPSRESAPPTHGSDFIHHVQTGIAYRMHIQGRWQRVRLNWVSPGRAFFVFTHGKAHAQTVSMTSRMLARLCDTERFCAFEQAELIERATVRARKQLASIGANSRSGVANTRL